MIRIVTDTGADFTKQEAIDKRLEIVHLSIFFNSEAYLSENDDDSFSDFYHKLELSASLPTTSQPAPGNYVKLFEDAKENDDEMIVISISSGMSGTYQTSVMAQEIVGYEKIFVVDSKAGIISQRALVDYALKLRDENKTVEEIVAALENIKDKIVVFGAVQTLKYLQMGGRISKTVATVGEVLTIKPIISTDTQGRVIMENKKRGTKAATRYLQDKLTILDYDDTLPVYFGYSKDKSKGQTFMDETIEKFDLEDAKGPFGIGGTIGTHVGPDGFAIAFFKKS